MDVGDAMVEIRRHLSDLSALVPGLEQRRHRRPARHHPTNPYLVELGVDAIWISPIFPSPMLDFGYDVSDYTGIDPLFGMLQDFDRLLAAAHESGLKILLDLVPNHTSDQHPWFVASRSSRRHPQRDWYHWRDPGAGGGPPNNWLSEFGGSAWEFDRASGQYYYHAYLKQQPDLNWRNPQVRRAIYDVMRFWLRRGVDGFRVDVLWHLIKDDQFRDNPPNAAGGLNIEVFPQEDRSKIERLPLWYGVSYRPGLGFGRIAATVGHASSKPDH